MAKAKEVKDPNAELDEELQKANLGDVVRTIDEMPDIDVNCTSTGLTKLDKLLHSEKLGLAEGRDIEIISDEPETGKTTAALQIGAAWQRAGKRVGICDIAGTITTPFLRRLGMVTVRDQAPELYMPVWIQTDSDGGGPKPAEEILDSLRGLVNILDLIIVDDVPCLIQASDLEKDADEATRTGGIAKPLTEHMRRTTHKRASVLWINQRREKIGGGMPGMPAKRVSMAGKAIPFWASIRIVLTMTEKIYIGSDQNKESIGMKVQVESVKNKTSPPFKKTILTYLDAEGFTDRYDVFQLAVKAGIIEKSGAWYSYQGERIGQGEWKTYDFLKENPDMYLAIKTQVDEFIRSK